MAAPKKKLSRRRDMSAAAQPTVRVFTTWTPELIRSAEIQADSGNLRYAANLCDWLLADDRVGSTLRSRVQALLGLEPTFERSGDKRRSARTVKALEVGEDWWAAYPESELSQLVTWGLILGVQPARHTGWDEPRKDHGGRILPMPECWHAQHLRFDNTTRTWRIKTSTLGSLGETEELLEPGDGEWILHTPFGKNRPWALGLWRALAPLVLLKHYARTDWAKISERGVLLALTCLDSKAGAELMGYTKEARAQLARDVYARGSNAVAALPPGIDLKAIQSAVNSKDIQGALTEMANTSIAIVVRGGNLSTEVEGGSHAAAETQARTGDLGNLKFDAQSLTTTLHDQSLVYWAEFNFGDSALAPWPVYPVDPQEDLKAKVEVEEKAFDTVLKAENQGFEVDRAKFLEEHKIEWCKPGEKPPAPVVVAPPEADPAADPDGEPLDDEDPDEPVAQGAVRRSAVGAQTKATKDGQEYTDRVAKRSAAHASRELAPTVAAMVSAVRGAGSYEEARAAIAEKYRKLASPLELASLTEAALTMANLGGRFSVIQDSPPEDP